MRALAVVEVGVAQEGLVQAFATLDADTGRIGFSFEDCLREQGNYHATTAEALTRLRAFYAEGLASGPAIPLDEGFSNAIKAHGRASKGRQSSTDIGV